MKVIKDKVLELTDIPKNIDKLNIKINDKEIKNISLEKVNRMIHGINNLDHIKWFRYKCDKLLDGNYKAVNLMFFRVDKKMLDEARTSLIRENVSLSVLPHIDAKTGNIHPTHLDTQKSGYSKIRQLVLCADMKNDPGPNTSDIDVNDSIYDYSPKTKVHKACYFPLIEDDDKLKENFRYKFLKEVAKNLPEEILSEEIIKEIKK